MGLDTYRKTRASMEWIVCQSDQRMLLRECDDDLRDATLCAEGGVLNLMSNQLLKLEWRTEVHPSELT